MNVLIVEDDEALSRTLEALFQAASMDVRRVATGKAASEAARAGGLDVIVLDIGLPDIDGFAVLDALRRDSIGTPIVILTARDTVQDRVAGLDLGADDYVLKPFAPTELVARVRAAVRRANGVASSVVRIGEMECDWDGGRVTVSGQPIDLRPREWAVLKVLVTRAGRVVERDMLAAEVFHRDEPVAPNALDVHVSRLRRKLGADAPEIRSVRGFGYRLQ